MNKTKIEWCSHTWNPVTGCFHGCPYCYARRTANRFGLPFAPKLGDPGMEGASKYDSPEGMGTMLELEEPYTRGGRSQPFPMAFMPTFHRYRLQEPERAKIHKDIFVVSMGDLFGKWVPTDWIRDVLDACQRAPWHRYLFLTKNPGRYCEMNHLDILPHGENFWYGSTVISTEAAEAQTALGTEVHTFWSMEPLTEPVDMDAAIMPPEWVILGAETGNRKNKAVPRREWVDQIAVFCAENDIPVFYKDNIRAYFPDLPASEFPWDPF